MNHLTLLCSALLSFTVVGCGVVVEPGEPHVNERALALPDDRAVDGDGPETVVTSPLRIEAVRAATSSRPMSTITFAANAPVGDVVRPEAVRRRDVVEQRFVTTTAGEVRLVVDMAPPTGTFSRVIVSDVVRLAVQTNHVMCESFDVGTFDPRCDRATPATRELPADGPITTAQWSLRVIHEATGAEVTTCTDAGGERLECVLPAGAETSYLIVASANGFADLWDGSPGFGQQVQDGAWFTGAFSAHREYLCFDWAVTASAMYCAARYEYLRFNALDRARLELDPITLQITANGSTSAAMASPALTWDAGDDDVPGVY